MQGADGGMAAAVNTKNKTLLKNIYIGLESDVQTEKGWKMKGKKNRKKENRLITQLRRNRIGLRNLHQ